MSLQRPLKAVKLSKKLTQQKNSCIEYLDQIPDMPESVKKWAHSRLEKDKSLIQICFGKLLLVQSGDVRQDGIYTGIWDYRLQELTLDLHKMGEDAAVEEIIYAVRHQDQLTREERSALSLLMWEIEGSSISKITKAVWVFTNRALRDDNPLYMGYGYNALHFNSLPQYQKFLKENLLYQNSRIDKVLDAYLRRFQSGQFSDLLWELKKQVKQSRKLWEKIIQAELKKIYNLTQLDKLVGNLVDQYWEQTKNQSRQYYWKPDFSISSTSDMNAYEAQASILGLTLEGISSEKVKQQFRKVVLKNHPDLGGSQEHFIKLKNARDELIQFLNTRELKNKSSLSHA